MHKKRSHLRLSLYGKAEEILVSNKCTNKKTKYTNIIGKEGVKTAEKTLRLEFHLKRFKDIRKTLGFDNDEVLLLTKVLDAPASVMLKEFEKFSATPDKLKEAISGFIRNKDNIVPISLSERFAIERFADLLVENDYDITLLKSHILTEYQDEVKESELAKFISRSNIAMNLLHYLAYRKPKSVTIMLKVVSNAFYLYKSSGIETKRQILNLVFPNFFLNGSNLSYTIRKPLEEFFKKAICLKFWRIGDSNS